MKPSTRRVRRGAGIVLIAGCGLATHVASAATVDLPTTLPNLVGGGIGSTSSYAGASDRMLGAVPGMRYVTSTGHLLEWYGPYVQYDFGALTGLQWGPALSLRLGRKHVDDPVVSQIHDVSTTVEGGGYVGYEYDHGGALPFRLRAALTVLTNAGAVYTGAHVALNGSAWVPLGMRVFAGAGLGATWVSSGFNQTYFGVTADDSARSGLPAFSPGGGLEQVTSWLALVYRIDRSWFGGAMIYYQRLTGAAADSPIVSQRGTRNQITYGVGIAYAFR
ncbi:MipA/OmpV family protein [Paraburkholderia sp.]|uniref:MipA/OmpV family protein n=1 Tax=Paraburkholderia sp. TaxID=1926495 RepID=UPI002398F510|nr:MipA/OmpV family protein [Paraburkholderia sp.]MDE1178998.1 MipA/OmpV family protein [Paraburkholderia sp.]